MSTGMRGGQPTGPPAAARRRRRDRGFTLAEMLAAVAIAGLLMAALGTVVGGALEARAEAVQRNALAREARHALERMTRAVSRTRWLLLPLAENTATAYSESVRDPGVLAVSLDPTLDRDGDGFADADNDKDGRVDEDWPWDRTDDLQPGIEGVDDDNDGQVDEVVPGQDAWRDNDEDGTVSEDPINGLDDDGDGAIDEDPPREMDADGAPGVAGVDDDGDGSVDEGYADDDDEDGTWSEDWLDAVVYRLSGTTLLERLPDPDPVDGNDWTERPLAADVSTFRVERLPTAASDRHVLVAITLALTRDGMSVQLATTVRVGAGL